MRKNQAKQENAGHKQIIFMNKSKFLDCRLCPDHPLVHSIDGEITSFPPFQPSTATMDSDSGNTGKSQKQNNKNRTLLYMHTGAGNESMGDGSAGRRNGGGPTTTTGTSDSDGSHSIPKKSNPENTSLFKPFLTCVSDVDRPRTHLRRLSVVHASGTMTTVQDRPTKNQEVRHRISDLLSLDQVQLLKETLPAQSFAPSPGPSGESKSPAAKSWLKRIWGHFKNLSSKPKNMESNDVHLETLFIDHWKETYSDNEKQSRQQITALSPIVVETETDDFDPLNALDYQTDHGTILIHPKERRRRLSGLSTCNDVDDLVHKHDVHAELIMKPMMSLQNSKRFERTARPLSAYELYSAHLRERRNSERLQNLFRQPNQDDAKWAEKAFHSDKYQNDLDTLSSVGSWRAFPHATRRFEGKQHRCRPHSISH